MLDVVELLRGYMHAALAAVPGYKALVLDSETMRMYATLFGRTELAEKDVVHVERLDAPAPGPARPGAGAGAGTGKKMEHMELKAVMLLRPTRDNINLLKRELRAPRFQLSHIYFTNLLSPVQLQELAEADALKEQIQGVQEFYGDVVSVSGHHFTIPCACNDLLLSTQPALTALECDAINRLAQGLAALMLAIRGRPTIRYQHGAVHAHALAEGLHSLVYKQHHRDFDFGARSSPLLLILDRRDDPVTPLLTQWTYEAMIHELLGISDKTTTLTSGVPDDAREMVLDARSDEFFRTHAPLTFGEVGLSVKALLEQYQSREAQHRQVESLDDMRRFVAEHMEFTSLQSNVTKHVNLMSNLSQIASSRSLLEVSEVEQALANPAAGISAAGMLDEVMRLCQRPNLADKDKVRLAALFALRFESDGPRVRKLKDCLDIDGVSTREPSLFAVMDAVLAYGGMAKRVGDLYASRSILSKARTMIQGLKGADNVFTQHTPLLTATLTNFLADRLDVAAYPFMGLSQDEVQAHLAASRRAPPKEVVVFLVGGTTYEEAKAVADLNARNPQVHFTLGGSSVLNSGAFMAALAGGRPAHYPYQ